MLFLLFDTCCTYLWYWHGSQYIREVIWTLLSDICRSQSNINKDLDGNAAHCSVLRKVPWVAFNILVQSYCCYLLDYLKAPSFLATCHCDNENLPENVTGWKSLGAIAKWTFLKNDFMQKILRSARQRQEEAARNARTNRMLISMVVPLLSVSCLCLISIDFHI